MLQELVGISFALHVVFLQMGLKYVLQGGIATFSNPLQGAIFGPMALSMLSLAYNLHFNPFEEEVSKSRFNRLTSRQSSMSLP